MVSRVTEVAIDCHDPHRLAAFWCAVLGYAVVLAEDDGDLVEIGPVRTDAELLEAVRRDAVPPSLTFARVPEEKVVKNRLHLDVSPVDRSLDAEVARLLSLGARRVDVGQPADATFVVLADPEGHEFCVLRSLAEGEFSL